MKNKITIIALLMLFTSGIYCQSIGLGLRYGIGLNSVSGNDAGGTSTLVSPLNLGLISEIGLHNNFAIQPELFITQKGLKSDVNGNSIDYNHTFLGLNVLPKIMFGNDLLEVYGLLGAGYSIQLSAKASSQGVTIDIDNVLSQSGSGFYTKKSDLAIIFGTGLGIKIPSGIITIDTRYSKSIGSAYLSNKSNESVDITFNQVGINLGYIQSIK